MMWRGTVIASCAIAALAGCAANPPRPPLGPPAIEYRGTSPTTGAGAPVAPWPDRPTTSPAVAEAAGLAPNSSMRPGGALRQPADNPSARVIPVQAGDSLYDISRRYSVNLRALIEANGLEPPYTLQPGQSVSLPPPNVHVVERGETLYSVSRRYNVDTRSLALMNGLARPWTVWPGDEILLPALARDSGRANETAPVAPVQIGIEPVSPRAEPVAATRPATAEGPISLTPGSPAIKPATPAAGQSPPKPPQYASNPAGPTSFVWPVSGPILAGYGVGANGTRNDGVNIGAEAGAEVRATAAGEVVYAGDELSGFGNLVLIRHEGGWVSAYAHAESLTVKEGDAVIQGQPIARAGATAKGAPQVHFELRKGKQPVDPALHLPPLKG